MQPDLDTIQNIHAIFNFVIHQFPPVVLFMLFGAILYFALTEKRKRQLVLTSSQEEKRLNDLVNAGKLSQANADKLLDAAQSLPEVNEAYPLPDIHLRLTSAFAKIFSIFKVMLITSKVALVVFFPLLSQKNEGGTFSYSSENGGVVLFSALFIIVTTLSIVHFRQSMLITRGSIKAAVWVTGIWLFDLLLLRFVLLGADNTVFILFATVIGFYTLWTLVWRKGACSYISNSSTSVRGRTALLAFILFLSFTYNGVFNISVIHNTHFTQQQSDINLGFTTFNPHSRIKLIHFIQATPGNNTKNFTESLISQLKTKLPNIRFSTQENGFTDDESINLAGGLVLTVSEVDLQKDRPRKGIFKHIFAKQGFGNGFKFKDIGKEKHSFTIQSYAPKNCYSYHYENFSNFSLVFNEYAPEINCTIAQNYQGDKDMALKKLSVEVADGLLKHIRPFNENVSFNAPVYFAAQPKTMEIPELSFFKGGKSIGRFHSIYYNNFTLFQFPLSGEKSEKDEILNELKNQNWKIEFDHEYNGRITIVAMPENSEEMLTITMQTPIENQTDCYGDMETYSPYGYAVMYLLRNSKFSPEVIERFRTEDIRSFSMCHGIKSVPKVEMTAYLERLLSEKNLAFSELEQIHRNLKQLPFMILEKDYKQLIESRMLEMVVEDVEAGSPKLGQLDKIIDILVKENKEIDELDKFQPFKSYYNKAKLAYDGKSKSYKFKKSFPQFSKRKLLIVDFSESPESKAKRRFLINVQKDGKKVFLENVGAFESMTNTMKNESIGGNIYLCQGKGFSGELNEAKLSDHVTNGHFVVGTYYDYESDTLTVEAIEPVAKNAVVETKLPKATVEPVLEQNDIKLEIAPTYGTLPNSSYKFRPFEARSIYITIDPKVQHKYLKESMLELRFSPNSTVNNRPIGKKLAKESNSFADRKTATWNMAYGSNTFLPTKEGVYKLSLIIDAKQRNKPDIHGSWRLPEIEHIVEIPKGEEEAYKFLVESGAASFLEHPYGVRPVRSGFDGPWNRKPAYESLIKLVEDYECPLLKQDIYRHCTNVLSYDSQHHGEYFKVDKKEVIKVMCRIDSSKTIEEIERIFKSYVSKGKKVDVENFKWWKETFNSEMEKLNSKF